MFRRKLFLFGTSPFPLLRFGCSQQGILRICKKCKQFQLPFTGASTLWQSCQFSFCGSELFLCDRWYQSSFLKACEESKQFQLSGTWPSTFWQRLQFQFGRPALFFSFCSCLLSLSFCFLEFPFSLFIFGGGFIGSRYTHLVKCFVGPLGDMKEVNTSGRIWKVELCTSINPLGTISGDDFDLIPLLNG